MPALLGLLVAFGGWLLRGLIAAAPFFLFRLFAGVGLALVVNKVVMDPLLNLVKNAMTGMPVAAIDTITATGFDQAISITFAAYAVAQSIKISLTKRAAAP